MRSKGFTLVELLVVIAIIAILMGLVVPAALSSLKKAGDTTKTAYDIAGMLEQARAFAMANNTYVFVGIAEVDSSVPASSKSQKTGPNAVGRVAVAAVASRDGTRGYDINAPGAPLPANLVAISKLQYFENIHLATTLNGFGITVPTTGGMARPPITSNSYIVGNAACQSVTPFGWPLGSGSNNLQYSFQSVINFDPQGVARIQYSSNTDTIVTYMEIGLQQANGTTVLTTGSNVAAIQLDAITGAVRIYRP